MSRSITQRGSRRTMMGDLTENVRLESEANTADGAGGSTRSWVLVATVAARAQPIAATEREDRGAVRAVGQVRFTVYRRQDITEGMRLVWGGVTFRVAAIDPDVFDPLFMALIGERGVAG